MVFPALMSGGHLVLPSEATLENPQALEALFSSAQVDYLKIVPSHLEALLESSTAVRLLPRQALVFGGEALSRELVDRVQALAPGSRVFNHYGPTETTVGVVAGGVSSGSIGLGRPLAGCRIYVGDRRLGSIAPLSVPGEIFLGGGQVARGYLGRPALTAERFVPDPFSGEPGARLYRSGDRGSWGPEGRLHFHGRLDHQVKIRGFRVEVGEIEATLRSLPGIGDGAVLAGRAPAGGVLLSAFYTSDLQTETGESLGPGRVLEGLRRRLPSYMVPSTVTALEALPLARSGKVDRRRLEVLAASPVAPGEPALEPQTPMEEVVSGIWRELLRVDRVGVRDDFFALGGHSLLATRLVARLRDALSLEVPIRELFVTPTVSGLARRLEALEREGRGLSLPPLVPVEREGELPLSFAQERLWFLSRLEPESPAYNVPLSLVLRGPLRIRAFEQAWNGLLERHETLRTRFVARDGVPRQVIDPPSSLDLPLVDLSGLAAGEVESETQRLAGDEARRPFDLERGPVLRVCLLRRGEEEHGVLATVHHIASDGWSRRFLQRDLAGFYQAALRDSRAELPALPVQYGDYALWQRGWLQGEVLDGEVTFWRERLAELPPLLALPTDRPRPAVQSSRGRRSSFRWSSELGAELEAYSRARGSTLFMTVLAGFEAFLHRLTGQASLAVGSPIAGRRHTEVEGLIGFFVNTLVLRGDLKGDLSFEALVSQARERVLEAHAHQDLPFERLVEELQPERSLSHSPLFQATLQVGQVNFRDEERRIPGLTVAPLAASSETAKFDLSLTLSHGAEGLRGIFAYRRDLVDGTTVARWERHLRSLLVSALAEPRQSLGELALFSSAERHQLVAEWSGAPGSAPASATFVELFAEAVERWPDRPALVTETEEVSYGELSRRASILSGHLRAAGVVLETLVALPATRCAETLVGLLAILASGVPIFRWIRHYRPVGGGGCCARRGCVWPWAVGKISRAWRRRSRAWSWRISGSRRKRCCRRSGSRPRRISPPCRSPWLTSCSPPDRPGCPRGSPWSIGIWCATPGPPRPGWGSKPGAASGQSRRWRRIWAIRWSFRR